MPALKVSQRKAALKAGLAKPRRLSQAEHDRAFQNGVRQFELRRESGLLARQVADRLWPTPEQG